MAIEVSAEMTQRWLQIMDGIFNGKSSPAAALYLLT